MAVIGNADATGGGAGPILFEADADMTGMSADDMAKFKLGTLGIEVATGVVRVLRRIAGVRSWVQVS